MADIHDCDPITTCFILGALPPSNPYLSSVETPCRVSTFRRFPLAPFGMNRLWGQRPARGVCKSEESPPAMYRTYKNPVNNGKKTAYKNGAGFWLWNSMEVI